MLGICEGVSDDACGVVEMKGEEVAVHVGFESGGSYQVVEAESVRSM
jgi:hypothetical protein